MLRPLCHADDPPHAKQDKSYTPALPMPTLSHDFGPLMAASVPDKKPREATMSVLDGVFENLTTMSHWQLLLAFIACIGYGLAQGGLLGPSGRRRAWVASLVGAVGFVLLGAEWMQAAMLVAIAVAGLGSFTAAVWLVCRLLGMQREPAALLAAPAAGQAASMSPDATRPHINRPVASA
jgi:hypothetical protein